VFNERQFWDGRANALFNGIDPYGPRTYTPGVHTGDARGLTRLGRRLGIAGNDHENRLGNPNAAGAGILVLSEARPGVVNLEQPLIERASLASQAVAIAVARNSGANGCNGGFAELGRRLLDIKPLSTQLADPEDSLFGKTPGLVNSVALAGLNTTYGDLIRKAFRPQFWEAEGRFRVDARTGSARRVDAGGNSQIEHNFSLFWGLAIQAYEQLLISDDAPFDRGVAALTPAALAGLEVFAGRGQCVSCHGGPLFTNAAVTSPPAVSAAARVQPPTDTILLGDGYPALFDRGFYNTGVRPAAVDLGLGQRDPYGFDLSLSRQYKWRLLNQPFRAPDIFDASPCGFAIMLAADCLNTPLIAAPGNAPRDAVDGAFKVPTLRNVGLTAPYFHNGGQSSLMDVVRFYNRGGDRRGPLNRDSSGLDQPNPFGVRQPTNLAPGIGNNSNRVGNSGLGLSETDMENLVQFLLALTDQRVACHADVFDHPELPLVMGQRDQPRAGTQLAKDIIATLPAVGRQGLRTCLPNTGDLFGSANVTDRRKQHDVLQQVLR
jgi:hypothetical protein